MMRYLCRFPGESVARQGIGALQKGLHPGFVFQHAYSSSPSFYSIVAGNESAACFGEYPLPAPTLREEYLGMVSDTIRQLHALENPRGSKTVISRIVRAASAKDGPTLAGEMMRRYPSACVFCYDEAPRRQWLGASPELLLSCHDGMLRTMALAGTRRSGAEGEWPEKDIEEQRIVTDFITAALANAGIKVETEETFSKEAGPVEHICTPIGGAVPEKWSLASLEALLGALSPTPALLGFPREDALRQLLKVERHSRGCYGGLVGILESAWEFDFYVNLRSMLLDEGRGEAALFSGSGITALSSPEAEWDETAQKAQTLLSLL